MDDKKRPIQWLVDNIDKPNLTDQLSDEELALIGSRVVMGYDIDTDSRIDWKTAVEAGLKIAMQETSAKTSPWPNCANIKHPLIAIAAIQFAARAYPNIIKGADIVKARVVGEDDDGMKEARALRISQHMSWQLTEQMEEWDEDTDKLLHALPIFGLYYRKTFYDTMIRRNKSEGRSPLRIVVNDNAKDLETARRVTDEVYLYKNEVIERERAGLFVTDIHKEFRGDEDEKPQELFLEQHCFFDLDKDGYEEPYIVTVHKESGKVARIIVRYDEQSILQNDKGEVVRIAPVQYFTKYPFFPSPDGKFHDLGFAQLLGPLNETINTLMNQLLDAGTLSNLQGGFIGKGIRWQGGAMRFTPGEWKPVDVTGGVLKDNIVPLPVREPSGVLFQLLGALTEMTDKLAGVSDAMSGEMPSQNTPATTVLAMIEQGLKVFTSIYKRVFRSLKAEYKKLYRLNRLYLPEAEYYRVLDSKYAAFREDYDGEDLDIVPVADPTISSEAQKLARSRAMLETMEINPSIAGKLEILKRHYEALDAPNIDKLLPPKEMQELAAPKQSPPDPALLKLEADMLKQKGDYELAMDRLDLERMKLEADVELTKALAIKAIAEAESKEQGRQLDEYKYEVDQLSKQVELAVKVMEANNRARATEGKLSESGSAPAPGDAGGMEEPTGDAGGVPIPQGDPGVPPGSDGGGGDVTDQLSGGDGPVDLPAVGSDLRAEFNAGDPAPGIPGGPA